MHWQLYLAALLVGASYWAASHWFPAGVGLTFWKGAGVALLALWAALPARDRNGWLLVTVLGFGALGDILIETHGLIAGAAAFLAGHLAAIILYLSNRREDRIGTGIGIATIVLVPAIAYMLSGQPGVPVYSLGLGAMAAAAWVSRFPRRYVALGALFFVLSDLLIFARLGPLAGSAIADFLVWPLYFAGQALIALGVRITLDRE
jgi:uncharacterized membrane protein YhhN